MRFGCCSPIASASTAAPRLRPLVCCSPIASTCVRFDDCSPIATASSLTCSGRFQPMPNVLEHSLWSSKLKHECPRGLSGAKFRFMWPWYSHKCMMTSSSSRRNDNDVSCALGVLKHVRMMLTWCMMMSSSSSGMMMMSLRACGILNHVRMMLTWCIMMSSSSSGMMMMSPRACGILKTCQDDANLLQRHRQLICKLGSPNVIQHTLKISLHVRKNIYIIFVVPWHRAHDNQSTRKVLG